MKRFLLIVTIAVPDSIINQTPNGRWNIRNIHLNSTILINV